MDEVEASTAELEEAIKKYLQVQGYPEGYLIDWMVVCAQHMALSEGGTATGISIHVSQGQALYRTSGLARYAMNKTDERMV